MTDTEKLIELKRLAKAHLDALNTEEKASISLRIAEDNFDNPRPEQRAHTKAIFAVLRASQNLRDAL